MNDRIALFDSKMEVIAVGKKESNRFGMNSANRKTATHIQVYICAQCLLFGSCSIDRNPVHQEPPYLLYSIIHEVASVYASINDPVKGRVIWRDSDYLIANASQFNVYSNQQNQLITNEPGIAKYAIIDVADTTRPRMYLSISCVLTAILPDSTGANVNCDLHTPNVDRTIHGLLSGDSKEDAVISNGRRIDGRFWLRLTSKEGDSIMIRDDIITADAEQ